MNFEEIDKVYPDTKAGVLSLLREESTFNIPESDDDVEVECDGFVKGVWSVKLDPDLNDGDSIVIVYLAGYTDPWGTKRIENDWESGSST